MYIFLYKYVYRLTIVSPFWLTQSPWFLAPAAPSKSSDHLPVRRPGWSLARAPWSRTSARRLGSWRSWRSWRSGWASEVRCPELHVVVVTMMMMMVMMMVMVMVMMMMMVMVMVMMMMMIMIQQHHVCYLLIIYNYISLSSYIFLVILIRLSLLLLG